MPGLLRMGRSESGSVRPCRQFVREASARCARTAAQARAEPDGAVVIAGPGLGQAVLAQASGERVPVVHLKQRTAPPQNAPARQDTQRQALQSPGDDRAGDRGAYG